VSAESQAPDTQYCGGVYGGITPVCALLTLSACTQDSVIAA